MDMARLLLTRDFYPIGVGCRIFAGRNARALSEFSNVRLVT